MGTLATLPKACYLGYVYTRIETDGTYYICCGDVPYVGSFENDGNFSSLWKSDKYKTLLYELRTKLESYNDIWNGACEKCPHGNVNDLLYEVIENNNKVPTLKEYEQNFDYIRSNSNVLGPLQLQFNIVDPCNHGCVFCSDWSHLSVENDKKLGVWKSKRPSLKMSYEVFKSGVDDMIELGGCEEIILCGRGEPALHPRFMDMVEYIKKNNFKCMIFTHYCAVDFDNIDKLVKFKVNELIINISAGTKETYMDTRNVKETEWNKLLNNLKYTIEKKKEYNSEFPEIVAKFVLTNRNIYEVGKMIDFSIELGVDCIILKEFIDNGVYRGDELKLDDASCFKAYKVIENKLKQYDFEKFNVYENEYRYNFISQKYNMVLKADNNRMFNSL